MQKIRIKLKSYDHNLIDKSAEKIIRTVKPTGCVVSGPIPLPTKKTIFTVNRSPHAVECRLRKFRLGNPYEHASTFADWTPHALAEVQLPSHRDQTVSGVYMMDHRCQVDQLPVSASRVMADGK